MNMEADQALPRIVAGLADVDRWRREALADAERKKEEATRERARIEADIADLQRQLKGLDKLGAEADAMVAGLAEEETRRNREVLLAGLAAEAELIEDRANLFAEACQSREAAVAKLLEDAEMAGLVEEYEQFQEAELTLHTLPAGYRKAILAHHEGVKRRLQPVFDAVAAAPPPIDREPAGITLVASVDPVEGKPEALALIMPVTAETYSQWTERGEDLQAQLAYRVVAVVGGVLRDLGIPDAPVQYTEYEGRLAIQIWLGDGEVKGDVKDVLSVHLDRLRETASELETVKLEIYTAWVSPDVVAPDEEGEDASA